jgi:hypothetical protein
MNVMMNQITLFPIYLAYPFNSAPHIMVFVWLFWPAQPAKTTTTTTFPVFRFNYITNSHALVLAEHGCFVTGLVTDSQV